MEGYYKIFSGKRVMLVALIVLFLAEFNFATDVEPLNTSSTEATTSKNAAKIPAGADVMSSPSTPPIQFIHKELPVLNNATNLSSTLHFNSCHLEGFDAASFIGGMVLAAGLTLIVFFACKFYHSPDEREYLSLS